MIDQGPCYWREVSLNSLYLFCVDVFRVSFINLHFGWPQTGDCVHLLTDGEHVDVVSALRPSVWKKHFVYVEFE